MPWKVERDGLRLIGDPHFSDSELQELLSALRKTRRNKPGSICDKLKKDVQARFVRKHKTIFILSKWCDWIGEDSRDIARRIGNLLFGRYPQPRFLDKKDRPISEVEARYEEWIQSILIIHEGNEGGDYQATISEELALLESKKQIIFYGPPGTGKTFRTKQTTINLLGIAQL